LILLWVVAPPEWPVCSSIVTSSELKSTQHTSQSHRSASESRKCNRIYSL